VFNVQAATTAGVRRQGRRWAEAVLRGKGLGRRRGDRELLALLAVCTLDMWTTLWWVLTGHATEANPFLSWTFAIHPVVFVLVKCGTFLPALLLARHLARRYPDLVTGLLRLVLIGYLGLYLAGTATASGGIGV
jgi:hypothetical protein